MMLKRNHKYKILLVLSAIGGGMLCSYLTFTPTPVFADYDWETRTLSDIENMQDMNAKICKNSAENESKALKDTRDGKLYYVTKLKDGNCWMTQNLAYNGGGTTTSISSWPSSGTPAIYYQGTHTDSSHTSIGNYYSFDAANATGGTKENGQDSTSICPYGWQLPTSGDNTGSKSFIDLLTQYGVQENSSGTGKDGKSYAITGSPLYFQRGGYLYKGSLNNSGTTGYYWSSTSNGSSYNYSLLVNNSNVSPSDLNGHYYGLSVRCVNADIYPEEPEQPPLLDDDQANVSVTVSPVISIDVVQDAVSDVDFTTVANSTIITNVSSNQQYQVLISTNQSNLERTPVVAEQNIPMLVSDSALTAGTSAWGIKKKLSAAGGTLGSTVDTNTYSPIGIGDEQVVFYKSAGAEALTEATGKPLTFSVGITVNPQLPSGTYSTTATVTAATI